MDTARLVRRLDWDTRHFGVQVARLNGPFDESEFQAADAWCRDNNVGVAYLQLSEDDVPAAQRAREMGFRHVETRVELVARRPRGRRLMPQSEVLVRPARCEDAVPLEQIARTSFRDSRFHRDQRFTPALCDALYVEWVRRGFRDAQYQILTAERERSVAGFALQRSGSAQSHVQLLGVGQVFRGGGIGPALVAAVLAHADEQGRGTVTVATQESNVRALQLYERAGFAAVQRTTWFHKWYLPLQDRPPHR